ncbi:MAG: hypothetical protein J0L67_07960 [Cytophagales bacterium]|nr:hypothetical protein [Cytophagales bacterium]
MEFYSRVTTGTLSKPDYLIETIVKTYRSGYREDAQNFSRISQKRITGTNTLPLYDKKRKLEYFAYETLPGFDIFLVDMIGATKLPNTIFNPNYLNRFDFRFVENTRFDSDTVCVIEYDDQGFKQSKERSFGGKLHISTRTLAILRHERRIGRNVYDVIYKPIGNHYFPYFIKSIHKAVHANSTVDVIHEAYITKVVTQNPEVFLTHFNQKDWHLLDVPFDKTYWDFNYPLQQENK